MIKSLTVSDEFVPLLIFVCKVRIVLTLFKWLGKSQKKNIL